MTTLTPAARKLGEQLAVPRKCDDCSYGGSSATGSFYCLRWLDRGFLVPICKGSVIDKCRIGTLNALAEEQP